jgi:glycosyltransferase involved in cell wall biosynthesis
MNSTKQKKVLFLYTELAGYVVACINEAAAQGIEVHVVRYPINPEAPFQFDFHENVKLYEIEEHRGSLKDLTAKINPSAIFCSGWIEEEYVLVCRAMKNEVNTVLLLDNQWLGSLRQRIACLVGRWKILPSFSHAWVPGSPQKTFAAKLGFTQERIHEGFYCADLSSFNQVFEKYRSNKDEDYPKNLLYVGRYLPFKGVELLWKCFSELADIEFSEWKLICLGTGDMWEERLIHPAIEHVGFVQPGEMAEYLGKAGAFILPSFKEPWGVVVQEMAAAGLPLLCSNTVGAASRFLVEGQNGFSFAANDAEAMTKALRKIMSRTDEELKAMGIRSHRIAQEVNPQQWVNTLLELS